MPVEIRELQINVTVNETGNSNATPAEASTGSAPNEDEKKKIINQCVEQVMDMLNNKKER